MSTQNAIAIDETLARKVLTVVDAGLVNGLGKPEPGGMCIEAAVNFAMGLPHSDNPPCVGAAVRAFKIRLNDSQWSSDAARTQGMRKLAIAQLGSDTIDQAAFAKLVAENCIRQIVPMALRSAASCNPKFAERLEAAAVVCASEGTERSARDARSAAYANAAYAVGAAAANADASAAYAAAAAAAAADASAAYAAANADAAAANAAYAAAAAANAAADGAAANAAAAAANAAANANAAAEKAKARDAVLNAFAEIGLQALIALNSPGCAYLWLCEAVSA